MYVYSEQFLAKGDAEISILDISDDILVDIGCRQGDGMIGANGVEFRFSVVAGEPKVCLKLQYQSQVVTMYRAWVSELK
jgi:hypothetical protein